MECKKHFQIIGNGSESIVVAGPDIGEVTKIYTGHSKDAALAAARSEFEILLSLSKVRSSGVRTPKPYKIIQSDHVGLVMEKCEGTKFPEFMLTHGCTHQIIQLIAGRLFKFIKEYVDLNNRPYLDCEPGNIMFDYESSEVVALDFSIGKFRKPTMDPTDCPFVVSLSEFLSSLLFMSVMPKFIFNTEFRERCGLMADELVALYLKTDGRSIELFKRVLLSYRTRITCLGIRNKIWFLCLYPVIYKKLLQTRIIDVLK